MGRGQQLFAPCTRWLYGEHLAAEKGACVVQRAFLKRTCCVIRPQVINKDGDDVLWCRSSSTRSCNGEAKHHTQRHKHFRVQFFLKYGFSYSTKDA